jgi:large subunit ribosomal protein L24
MERKKFHVKKNDLVMVIAGKDKGKSGKVLSILPRKTES